jgi:transposase-like protein
MWPDDEPQKMRSQGHAMQDTSTVRRKSDDGSQHDAVAAELAEWQSRSLDAVYPVIFIGALMIKVRDGQVANRPVYLAIGIDCDGAKQVLGLWVGPMTGESAKFWLTVLSELKSRGVGDVCIVCCDGLTGLPDAMRPVPRHTRHRPSLVSTPLP